MNENHDEAGRFSSGPGGSARVGFGKKKKLMGEGTSDRQMVGLLRERLSAGGLKPGEKESIQRRIEQHSKNIVTGNTSMMLVFKHRTADISRRSKQTAAARKRASDQEAAGIQKVNAYRKKNRL